MSGIKHGVRGDAWFGSVRAANEIALRGHDGVFQIKLYHSLFPKEYIEEALKDALGGAHASRFLPEDDETFTVRVPQEETELSFPALTSSITVTAGKNVLHSSSDVNGILHYLVKYDVTKDPLG
jgi:hypothetical protein